MIIEKPCIKSNPNSGVNKLAACSIDLNKHLLVNENESYLFRINNNALALDGIKQGDFIIVDKSLQAVNNDLIVVSFKDQTVIRKVIINETHFILTASGQSVADMHFPLYHFRELLWGVVTCVISNMHLALPVMNLDFKS